MPLVLTITPTDRGSRPGDRQIRTLAQGSLSIGRAPGNDWVLADPEQHLSRTHCMIAFEAGRYVLTDLSTNGVLINGAQQPTSRNSRTILTDGDSVQLGNYVLEVAEADGPTSGAPAGPFGAAKFLTPQADPLGPTGGESGPIDVDPLDDPLGRPATPGFSHPMRHVPPPVRAADPFDVADENRRRSGEPDDDLFRGKSPHDPFEGPVQNDHADIRSHAYAAPRAIKPSAPGGDIDFDALIGDFAPTPAPHPLDPRPQPPAAARPAAASPVPANPLDSLLGDFPGAAAPAPAVAPPAAAVPRAPAAAPTPAPVAARAPRPASPAPAPEAAEPAADRPARSPEAEAARAGALLAAFLDGAGIPRADVSSDDPEAMMRAVGVLFRAFIVGTREVLMSRAEIKHEMRVEQTMLRARDNNALKFSISAEEAAIALLQPNRPGYKAPVPSVEEAFKDIRGHEMAVMAGVQTALGALLKRFDPAGLEARLQPGMLDGILPSARKARFWELFCMTYKDIAREAEDDFHSVFGREFARAYDAQVNKL